MIRTSILLTSAFFSQYSMAGCVEINGKHYCGEGECIAFKERAYCAKNEFGKVLVFNGAVYCGAGNCLEKDNIMYCSQFAGGGIIEKDKALWTGPGDCIIHDGNAYCSKKPRGKCFVSDNAVNCEGGWVRELPQPAEKCAVTLDIN